MSGTSSAKLYEPHGIRILEYPPDGPPLRSEKDALAMIEEALSRSAQWIVIPSARLDPDFFNLRTRIAGEFLQKFINYQRKIAILGDFSEFAARSESLRAFICEANRGDSLWFLADFAEFEQRLTGQ